MVSMGIKITKRHFIRSTWHVSLQENMNTGRIYILLAAFLWGTLGVMASGLNASGYNGFEVASLRIVFSGLALGVAVPFLWKSIYSALKKSPRILILHSLSGVFLYNVFYFLSIDKIGVIFSVCLLYTSPIWTLLFTRVILKEHISLYKIIIAFTSFIGVVITLGIGVNDVQLSMSGIFFGAASGASYALYYVIGKRALKDVQPNTLLVSSFTISGLVFLFIPETWEGLHRLSMEQKPSIWAAILIMSLIGTVFSYFLFTRGLKTTSPPSISIITTIEPLTAVTLAAIILGDVLQPVQWLGIFLIVGSNAVNGLPLRALSGLKVP